MAFKYFIYLNNCQLKLIMNSSSKFRVHSFGESYALQNGVFFVVKGTEVNMLPSLYLLSSNK